MVNCQFYSLSDKIDSDLNLVQLCANSREIRISCKPKLNFNDRVVHDDNKTLKHPGIHSSSLSDAIDFAEDICIVVESTAVKIAQHEVHNAKIVPLQNNNCHIVPSFENTTPFEENSNSKSKMAFTTGKDMYKSQVL